MGWGVEEHRATRAGSADTVFSLFGSLCRDFPFRFNCLPHWQSRALFSLSSAAITLIRSNNLTYLGNVFQAKWRDVGFSKPDVLNGRRIQTGVAHWDWLLPSSSRPSPHPDSLLVSETKGGI